MGVVKGLSNLTKQMEPNYEDDGPKAKWFGIKDGQTAKIRFLQELDPDSENYNEKSGLAFIGVEHANPSNYRKKALCSIEDEGRCYGCEMHTLDPKAKWHQKKRLYANVLAQNKDGELEVQILSQGMGAKAITETVINYAGEVGSITNVNWSIKRTGSGVTDTSYSAFPMPTKGDAVDVSKYELYDLEKTAVRTVPYAEQEAFYMGNTTDSSSKDDESASSSKDIW